MVKKDLQMVTSEVIREEQGDDFLQAVVIKNKRNEAIVGWYNSPCMKRESFYEKLKYVLTKHDGRYLAGGYE